MAYAVASRPKQASGAFGATTSGVSIPMMRTVSTPLGSSTKVPTALFNGYGALVADLYKGLESEPLFM